MPTRNGQADSKERPISIKQVERAQGRPSWHNTHMSEHNSLDLFRVGGAQLSWPESLAPLHCTESRAELYDQSRCAVAAVKCGQSKQGVNSHPQKISLANTPKENEVNSENTDSDRFLS